MRRRTDFGLMRSRKPQRPVFVLAAVGLTFIALCILELAIQFFHPINLTASQIPATTTNNLIQENPTPYNPKGLSSRKLIRNNSSSYLSPNNDVGEERRVAMSNYVFPLHEGGDLLFPSPHSPLEDQTNQAYIAGAMAFRDLIKYAQERDDFELISGEVMNSTSSCPESIGRDFEEEGNTFMDLPCGIQMGSVVTIRAQPLGKEDNQSVVQFAIELLGFVEDEGEEAPQILHLNPRLRGDFSGQPVIELNTGYRGQWGLSQRCTKERSFTWSPRVDGKVTCEGWSESEEDENEVENGEFPFMENEMFEMNIEAGAEGYHISVDGRPMAAFWYRPGFPVNDVSTISVRGDVQVKKIEARLLPATARRMSFGELTTTGSDYKAPILTEDVDLFVGIVSATQHFTERMAIRRTWLRSHSIQISQQNTDKRVNLQLMKEANYYGDVVILPFIDHYHLLVLKTLAIVEFGVQHITSKYIMKCDDDTYVNIDAVVKNLKEIQDNNESMYMGLFNWEQGPEREGKWAVTYEEWPAWNLYPPYANGPGYIISKDIGQFIISSHRNHSLEIFKMEDVCMGLWVLKYNETVVESGRELGVKYEDNWRFFQAGCVEGYFSAHYQSPRQMLCLWEKLIAGTPQCCYF